MKLYSKNKISLKPLEFFTLDDNDIILLVSSFLILLLAFCASFLPVSFLGFLFYKVLFFIWALSVVSFFVISLEKHKTLLQKFLLLHNIILIVAIFIVFIIALFSIEERNYKEYHSWFLVEIMLSLLMIIPYIFIVLPKTLLVLLFHKILRYRFFEVENSDFYTDALDYDIVISNEAEAKKYDIVFIVTSKTLSKGDNFNLLKQNFAKLIYFWYAHKYEKVYLRFILPIWSILWGIIFFIATLSTLDHVSFQTDNNVIRMSFVVIFLTILFISMIYQINDTLNPKDYINDIIKDFKRLHIKFKEGLEPAQKFFLFLDRNFLIYIYDKKYDRRVLLNKDKSFEEFILDAQLDKEGRDNIASIFVTIFIVIFIEIFVQVLADSKTDDTIEDINKTLHSIKETLKSIETKGEGR